MSDLVTRLIIRAGFMGEKPAEESAAALMREAVYEIGHLRARVAELEEGGEPVAHMYPSDLKRFEASETFAEAYSVAVGNPSEESVPLYATPQPVKVESIAHLIELELINNSSSDAGVICDAAAKRIIAMLAAQEKQQ
ncbi:hypothetical protein [Porticoccus sp.]